MVQKFLENYRPAINYWNNNVLMCIYLCPVKIFCVNDCLGVEKILMKKFVY